MGDSALGSGCGLCPSQLAWTSTLSPTSHTWEPDTKLPMEPGLSSTPTPANPQTSQPDMTITQFFQIILCGKTQSL